MTPRAVPSAVPTLPGPARTAAGLAGGLSVPLLRFHSDALRRDATAVTRGEGAGKWRFERSLQRPSPLESPGLLLRLTVSVAIRVEPPGPTGRARSYDFTSSSPIRIIFRF